MVNIMKNEELLIKIEEYKTLRDEILKCSGWILQIQLGVFASTALIFSYLFTVKNVNEYAFFVPFSAIIPAYFINQDLLYTIYRISAYINVHLTEFKWEIRIHNFRNRNFKNQLLQFKKLTYFDINSLFYFSTAITCIALFLSQNSFSYKKIIISLFLIYLFRKIFKPINFHIKRNEMIEEWKNIT